MGAGGVEMIDGARPSSPSLERRGDLGAGLGCQNLRVQGGELRIDGPKLHPTPLDNMSSPNPC